MTILQLYAVVMLSFVTTATSQECPTDWETFQTSCYKFVWYPAKSFPDAELDCSSLASSLVSIDNEAEHNFVTGVLLKSDIRRTRYSWYTSGVILTHSLENEMAPVTADHLVWEGDGTDFDPSVTHLWQPQRPENNELFGRVVVYRYASGQDQGYVFGRSRGNVKRPYICEIPLAEVYRIYEQGRDYDYGVMAEDLNDIPRGPNITGQPNDLVILSSSLSVHIDCVASGNPSPTYKWFRQSTGGRVEITSALDNRYIINGGRLIIYSPRELNDSGVYQCQAENTLGVALSNPIQISFGELRQFSNVKREIVNVHEYQGAMIQCIPPFHKPGVSFQWYRDSPENFLRPEHQVYIFISDNGKLYFSEATKIDEGSYHCVVTLRWDHDQERTTNSDQRIQSPSRTSRDIPLFVLDSGQTAWGPEIQDDFVQIMPQIPLRGQDVRLECFAYGTAPIIYSWSRENDTIPSKARIMDSSRVLVIPDVQFEDAGNYRCQARRTMADFDEKVGHLKIAAAPYFDYPLRNQHLDIGGELTWRCAARAIPTATYKWYKNGVEIKNQPGVIEVNRFILKIMSLDPQRDNGTYQCAATNIHGTRFTSAEIRVLSFKPSFAKTPQESTMHAAAGGNATIVCQPEAAPYPEFSWSKNGVDVGATTTSERVRLLSNGNLFISPVELSDAGTYTCTATNQYGSDSSHGYLDIAQGIVINTTPRSRSVRLNDTEFLPCVASYPPGVDMIYIWKFNGRIIDIDHEPYFGRGAFGDSGGLYIRNAQFEHDGVFTCVARTVNDVASVDAKITVVGPPSQPAGVFMKADTNSAVSMVLRWTAADDHGQPILFYIIEAFPVYQQVWRVIADGVEDSMTLIENEDKRGYQVEGLKPGNNYKFRIRAVNEFGIGEASEPSLQYSTLVAAPTTALSDVGGGGGKVGVLTITWTPLNAEDLNGNGIGYRVYWRKKGGQENDWSQSVEHGRAANKSVATVGKINFYREYEVKVQAFNDLGSGPNSSVVTIFSAADLPTGAVYGVGVDGYNETAMLVSWNIPDTLFDRNSAKGVITGFQVNCWNGSRWIKGSEKVPKDNWRRRAYAGPDDTQVLVVGVITGLYHYCDVQVRNSAGLGPESDPMTYSSNDLAPTLYPTEVAIHSHGFGSVMVTYRGVTTSELLRGEEPLDGYRVRHWLTGDDIRTATYTECGRKNWCVIDGLKHSVLYDLRVYAYSSGGDGKMSPPITFTFAGGMTQIDLERYELLAIAPISSPSVFLLLVVCLSYILTVW